MKVIFDTNILISRLLLSRSIPAKAVDQGLSKALILSSHETLIELSEVLSRKKFDKYISIEERRSFLQLFIQTTEKVEIIRTVRECRDPKDDKFLELAVNGEADFLITGDEDLLSIGNFRGTVILTASGFLDHIKSDL